MWRASSKNFSHVAFDSAYEIKASWSFRWKSFTELECTMFAGSIFHNVHRPKQERRIVSVCLPEDGIAINVLNCKSCSNSAPLVGMPVLIRCSRSKSWHKHGGAILCAILYSNPSIAISLRQPSGASRQLTNASKLVVSISRRKRRCTRSTQARTLGAAWWIPTVRDSMNDKIWDLYNLMSSLFV